MIPDRNGKLIVVLGTAALIEVHSESTALDLGFGERLNMEGGRTGRMVAYRVSGLLKAGEIDRVVDRAA